MPRKITVTFEDGSTHVYEGAPDDISPEEVTARAEQDFGLIVTSLDGGREQAPAGVEPATVPAPTAQASVSMQNLEEPAFTDEQARQVAEQAGKAQVGDVQLKVDSLADPDYVRSEMTEQQKRQYLALVNNPNVTREQLTSFVRSVGRDVPDSVWQQIEDVRNRGESFGAVQSDYREKLDQLTPQEFTTVEGLFSTGPSGDGFFSQVGRGFMEAGQEGSSGILGRTFADWFDVGGENIDRLFPDLTPEERENLQEAYVADLQRNVRKSNEQASANDSFIPWFIGQAMQPDASDVLGVKPAKLASVAARITGKTAELGGASAIADIGYQAADIAGGVQDEFDIGRTGMALATGAALGGTIQGGVELGSRVLRTTPDTPAPAPTGAPIVVPTARKGSKAYTTQISEVQKQISAQVNDLTKGWTNLPEVEVFDNFKGIKRLNNKGIAVYSTKTLDDGTVVPVIKINSEALLETAAKRKVSPESLVEAATFHESLGHHGLLSVFDKDLDAFLDDIYVNGEAGFRKQVDDWLEKNKKAYANFAPVKRRILATEEVLAGASEKGPIVRRKLDGVANYIKDFARTRFGMNLKYSQREIRSYLAVAHERTMKGQRAEATPDVNKNMIVYHGSGADFDKFDHSKMGTGEGQQVFGWGTYLTDKKQIAESYKNTIGKREVFYKGEKVPSDPVYGIDLFQLREKLVNDGAKDANLPSWIMEDAFLVYNSDPNNVTGQSIYERGANDFDDWAALSPEDQADFNIAAEIVNKNFETKSSGKFYEVDIPDDAKWLEWETPLKDQPDLQASLESQGFVFVSRQEFKDMGQRLREINKERESLEITAERDRQLDEEFDVLYDQYKTAIVSDFKGEQVYREISQQLGPKGASDLLAKLGYTGNRYLANNFGKNRGRKNDGTDKFNYVVFDDNTPKIVNKYMMGDEDVLRNDLNYQDLKKSISSRKKEFASYEQDLAVIRDAINSYADEIDLDSPAVVRLDEIAENSSALIDRYEALFADASKKMDYRVEKELRDILNNAYSVYREAATVYNAAIQDLGVNDNPYNPFRPTPRVGNSVFEQADALEVPDRMGMRLDEEDIFYTRVSDTSNDRYMMGDEGRIEDQDFDGRMTMILRELQDEYVPTQRSQAEAQRAARIAGLRSRQYKSQKGLEDLDIRLFQYEAVNERYQARLLRITDRMAQAKEAEDINGYVRASDEFKRVLYEYKALAAKIQDDQAQIGRALNAMKALTLTKRNIADTLGLMGGNKADADAFAALDDPATLDALAKMMSAQIQAGNTLGAAKLAEKVGKPYWWQYGLSYLHLSMLSGLGTHAVNAYDAVNVLGRKLEERMVGAAVGSTRRAFGAKDTMSAMEGLGFTYGVLRALVDADTYKNAYRAFKEGYEFQPFDARIERQDARIPYLSKINDALYASDMFWRSFHMSANMYSLGLRKAYKDGFRGKELFEETYANVVNADKELFDEAKRHADEALLVDTPSSFTSWLEAGKNIKPNMTAGQQARAFTLNLVFPFLRVSDRLIFQALKRVPLVAFVDHNTRREWGMGGAARDAVVARQLMGGALISYYWMMADPENQDQEGYIEGYSPENYEERMGLEATGYRPESVVEEDQVMRNANQINITANPFNTRNNVAVLVASIRQQWEQSKKTDADAKEMALLMASAMRAGGTFLMKQGYAGNVLPYVEALEAGPQQEGVVAGLVGDLASRAVPAAVRQFNQMYFDPIKRDTTGDKSVSDRILGRVQSGIPGLSDLMPANLTALGEEQDQGRTLLRLGDGTEIKQGDPYTELRRLERSSEKPLLTEFDGTVDYEGESIKLNAYEKNKWQAIQGQYLRDVMFEWVTSEDWKQMSDEEKLDVVKDIKEEAYEDAKEQLLDEILTARGK